MNIERNGISYALTAEELEKAYREQEKRYRMDDISNVAEEAGYGKLLTSDDISVLAEDFLENYDCSRSENDQMEALIKAYVSKNYPDEISAMFIANQIADNYDYGLLGFTISEEMVHDNYDDPGEAVISLFLKYPGQAKLLNEMLSAVCGWKLDSLSERMEEKREYYDSL